MRLRIGPRRRPSVPLGLPGGCAVLVRDLMTTAVVAVSPTTTVHEAARLLAGHGFALLPVLEEGATRPLVGVVGQVDLRGGRVLPAPSPSGRHGDQAPPGVVRDVMTRAVHTVAPGTDLADAAIVMVDRGLRSLPVLDEGVLVGIVTRHDITRVLARTDADLQHAIERTLNAYVGWARWTVHVRDGEVVLCDDYDDPVQQHIATVIAAAVPGAVHVDTHLRSRCPRHAATAAV